MACVQGPMPWCAEKMQEQKQESDLCGNYHYAMAMTDHGGPADGHATTKKIDWQAVLDELRNQRIKT